MPDSELLVRETENEASRQGIPWIWGLKSPVEWLDESKIPKYSSSNPGIFTQRKSYEKERMDIKGSFWAEQLTKHMKT